VERLDKKGRSRTLDIRPRIESLVGSGDHLSLTLGSEDGRAARVVDVLVHALGLDPAPARVRRVALYYREGDRCYELMDAARARPLHPSPEDALAPCR